MKKITAYSIQLSYDVTSAEKEEAEKALIAFNKALKLLNAAATHLNIMYTPFKDHPEISVDEIIEFRAALRRFRDKSIENFNTFKISAFKCIKLMKPFSSDTQSAKLIKSFISAVEDIENNVNKFSELFNALEDKEFTKEIINIIEIIREESDQLEQIIDDRIKTHIQTNILGKTWIDSISDELQINIEEKVPLLIELDQERKRELNQVKNNQNIGNNSVSNEKE